LRDFAAAALERAHRRLVNEADGIDWHDAAARHGVRIRVKRLRYTGEFFAPAFPARRTAAYVAALKELQTILGELNDNALGRRLARLEADDTPLLRRLAPAWARFEKRPAFWRAAERKPRRAAR
jgi:CHAD domain-containing protein